MDRHKLERTIATRFLGWGSTKWQNHFIDNKGSSVDVRDTFTNKMQYAWLLAEKMKEKWPDFSISSDEDGNWNVSWGFDGYGWKDVSDNNIMMALCLASLKSIDINTDELLG